MHRYIIFVVISVIALSGWGFLSYGIGPGYQSYLDNWEYRRLHPELIPAPDMIRLFDMGHTTTYASYSWLSLIQYIGDNVGGNRFLDFSHRMLSQITSLHPYFTRPYEIDLILAPVSSGENMTIEQIAKNKTIIANAIELGKKGIPILCDTAKIAKIQESPISLEGYLSQKSLCQWYAPILYRIHTASNWREQDGGKHLLQDRYDER
jgi:hypothetical protein